VIDGYEVVDAHIHVQPWEMLRPGIAAQMRGPRRDLDRIDEVFRDPGRLVAMLDEEGIDAALLVNYIAPEVMGFTDAVNGWVAAFCRGRERRLVAVGSVHPRLTRDGAGDVDRLIDLGIRALKIHPPHMLFHANAYRDGGGCPALATIYARAEERRLPVIIHTGTSIFTGARNKYADPMDVDDVAVDFPELPIVMAHAGRPLWMETCFFLLRRHRSVRIDISGIPPGKLLDYLPRLEEVAGRALWGTDWPSPGVRSMGGNVRAFLGLPLPEQAKRAVLGANARALFGLTA